MNLLTKFCFNPFFASQFKKPQGLFGILVSKVMRDHNFFVYPGIEQYADFKDKEYILEIGYGPGVGLNYYLNKYNLKYDGLDLSKLMYLEARKRNKKYINNGSLKLYQSDFQIFDFGNTRYDQIVFANVIYFWDNLNIVFNKMYQLLKTNGKLVFYMSNKGLLDKNKVANNPLFIKYTDDYVKQKLEEVGFANISINSIINTDNEFLIIKANKNKLTTAST